MRALFTVIGGLLALAGGLVLWPSWEPGRLFTEMRAAIAAYAGFAEAELSALVGETRPATVEAARRAAGVASNNMEASLSRALHEPGHANRFRLEAVLVIDAALRRMGGRLTALQLDQAQQKALPASEWRRWRDWIAPRCGRSRRTPRRCHCRRIRISARPRIRGPRRSAASSARSS